MRIYWTLIGKDLDKLNLPNDLDINVLTFNTDGVEHCLDIIGQSDLGFDGLNIEGSTKSELIDLNFPNQTPEELLEAFKHGTDFKFDVQIADECEVETARLEEFYITVFIGDVAKKIRGTYGNQ